MAHTEVCSDFGWNSIEKRPRRRAAELLVNEMRITIIVLADVRSFPRLNREGFNAEEQN